MRRAFAFAAACAMLPLPALADVTALYSAGRETIAIEVDDGGDYRAGVDGKVVILHRDGVDYLVIYAGDAPVVTKLDPFLALVGGPLTARAKSDSAAAMPAFVLTQRAAAAVGGRQGVAWWLGPDQPEAPRGLEVVMSSDPALAPIGAAFRGTIAPFFKVIAPLLGAQPSNLEAQVTALLSKGTPLEVRAGDPLMTLDSIDTAEIKAERFALPGDVVEAAEALQALETTRLDRRGAMPPLLP